MKNSVIFLISFLFLFAACEKSKNDKLRSEISGSYTGSSERHAASLQEVFTSPQESHFEWVTQSQNKNPDTLLVSGVSKDSFDLGGPISGWLGASRKRFAWNELVDNDSTFQLNQGISAPDYSEQLNVSFYKNDGRIIFNYSNVKTYSEVSLGFNGNK